tara:strand:+ start:2910 stop:4112 length:1203 start_codon:yes stop_codon:yes gene_type:complete
MTVLLDKTFLILSILGFYFYRINLFDLLPNFLTLITTFYFLIRHFHKIKFDKIIIFLLVLLTLNLFSVGSANIDLLIEKISKCLYLSFNIFVAYLFYLHFQVFSRSYIGRVFFNFLVIIFFGLVLEFLFEPINRIESIFSNYFYPSFVDYDSQREIFLYGELRPTFFLQEASHVGMIFSIFSILALKLSDYKNTGSFILFFLLSLIFIVRTPFIFIGLIFYFLFRFFRNTKFFDLIVTPKYFFLLIFFLIFFVQILVFSQGNRILFLANAADTSLFFRFILPISNMIEVMRINPFTGIGLTSGEIISEHIFTTANNYNISLETARYRQNLFQIPNAFFDIFISFGILGSMLIAFICKRIVNLKNITWIDCVSILLLINTAGILNIFLYQSIFALYFTVDE